MTSGSDPRLPLLSSDQTMRRLLISRLGRLGDERVKEFLNEGDHPYPRKARTRGSILSGVQ